MVGLTLEGGGGKGAYQIGAWKAFRQKGITFSGVTGTSVGALNGAMILQDDFELAWNTWYTVEPNKVLSIDDDINELITDWKLDQKNVSILLEEIRKVVKNAGIDTSPLYQLIQSMINEEKIRKSSKDFGFVTYSLTDMVPLELFKEDVPAGKLADYLMASSYLPVFKEKKFDGKRFLDGSFYNNLPINMLLRKNYSKIYAVRLYGRGRIIKVNPGDAEIVYICPNRELGGVLNFSKEQSRRNLKLGYLDTLRVLDSLKGTVYYFYDMPAEHIALKMLFSWPDALQKEICITLDLDQKKALNRTFMEEAIPTMIDIFDLPKEARYQDLLMTIIEAIAKYFDIEPLQLYGFDEMIRTILALPDKQQKNKDSDHKMTYFFKPPETFLKKGKEKKRQDLIALLSTYKAVLFRCSI
ncbi:patatin-like phospholipase family protein [Tindallia californiensis]|uniref:NTE family protein n=1 Tax=Tindallia californiensis TaxID=159292 RepID=A0A1H3KIX0_9FIRM|nr:patatin-like phospholipase family protein [Tindallia californiensis]SDY52009.1 NTE family protein [Tindallia californiensis]